MFRHVFSGLATFLAVLSLTTVPAAETGRGKKPAAQQARNWTDATGQHRIRATLLGVEDDKVRLRKSDGSEITVPLERLSELDQKWVAKQATALESQAAASEGGGEWPSFRGPNRDGKSPDTGLLKEWPEGGPKLLWKTDILGEGFASVAVSGGQVYVTGNVGDQFTLFAFNLDGSLNWKVVVGPKANVSYPATRATPTVDGNRLYLLSSGGKVTCHDVKNGKVLWSRDKDEFGGSPGGWGYAESVLIYGNLAIFKPGGAKCVVALNKETGRDVWTSQGLNAGPEYSSCLVFDHDGMPILTTGTNQGIVFLNPKNGALLGKNGFSAGNTANCPTPAYSDGHVFWANGYGKGGVCLKLGRAGALTEAWTTHDMVCHHGGYVIHEGHIYGNHDDGWACLELATGKKTYFEKAVGKGSVCWADGMLYLFSENHGQAALATCSPDGLQIKGKVKVDGDGPSWAHPVVIGGRLYLRYDKNLYCYDVKG